MQNTRNQDFGVLEVLCRNWVLEKACFVDQGFSSFFAKSA